MSKNMAHIKLLAFKEDESHYSEIVICNINNIMLIKILEVIQRWESFLSAAGVGQWLFSITRPKKRSSSLCCGNWLTASKIAFIEIKCILLACRVHCHYGNDNTYCQ